MRVVTVTLTNKQKTKYISTPVFPYLLRENYNKKTKK